ncbi:MAG: acyl carrier protein [Gammaproteobacteria bacterium]|nr:acyl carrier protein [Gammaproteobacteria bacterium]
MASADRIMELARDNLGLDREPSLDASFSDSGVSSVDAIAFMKVVSQEFGVEISADDLAQISSLRGLAGFVDSRAG